MRISAHFICEASLIQGRLHLQSWAREYLVNKVSSGWYLFDRTDRVADSRSPLPTYADIFNVCQTILDQLTAMMTQPPPVSPIQVSKENQPDHFTGRDASSD